MKEKHAKIKHIEAAVVILMERIYTKEWSRDGNDSSEKTLRDFGTGRSWTHEIQKVDPASWLVASLSIILSWKLTGEN